MKPKNSMNSTDLWKHRKMYKKTRVFRAKLIDLHHEDAYSMSAPRYIGRIGVMKAIHYTPGTKWIGGTFFGHLKEDSLDNMHILFGEFKNLGKEDPNE